MKLLLFSDVHCSQSAVGRLVELSDRVDVLVGAGDFGTMRRGTDTTLAPFQAIDKPQVLVCGNGESDDELRQAADWDHANVLHGDGTTINGVSFFGLGGGIPVTPFGSWSFDLDEQQAAERLADCPKGGVLVMHSPPYGAVDVSSRGKHLGSESIRETVIRCEPKLVVCGHIHDSAGQWEAIGKTMVVNAGPEGVIWDLDSNEALAK